MNEKDLHLENICQQIRRELEIDRDEQFKRRQMTEDRLFLEIRKREEKLTARKIMSVAKFNTDNTNNRCTKTYGYVMPLYHGWDWAKTKKRLIERYT